MFTAPREAEIYTSSPPYAPPLALKFRGSGLGDGRSVSPCPLGRGGAGGGLIFPSRPQCSYGWEGWKPWGKVLGNIPQGRGRQGGVSRPTVLS